MKIKKKFTVEPLFKTIKGKRIYSSLEISDVLHVFERNNVGLKNLSIFYLNRQVTHLPS
jgi:hypothetical protein